MRSAASRYFDALVLHETRLWALVEQRVRSADETVSLARFEILRTVHATQGGARVQDVADTLLITVGAASRIVERLVNDDLLERSPHPTDRRSHRLHLTSGGEHALGVTTSAVEAALTGLLGAVDDEQLTALTKGLGEIDAHLCSDLSG